MEQVITFEDRWGDVFVLEHGRDCDDCAFAKDQESCLDAGTECFRYDGAWVKD